ncbi:hypothetical protein VNO78_34844 [Psophocarpus tetragonolobus]|uniref:Uncharacterized protein n=1 Tax=Psophocarpus tetragonolobus TaxID=3891 RepID=A0AAN9NSS6_PSOTE
MYKSHQLLFVLYVNDEIYYHFSHVLGSKCSFPLWIAMVWPIIVGIMVDALDQVIIMSFSVLVLSFFIFLNKLFATKGFFFSERVTVNYSFLL